MDDQKRFTLATALYAYLVRNRADDSIVQLASDLQQSIRLGSAADVNRAWMDAYVLLDKPDTVTLAGTERVA